MARVSNQAPTFVSSGSQDLSNARGAKVAPGWVRVWTSDGDHDLLCLQGETPPTVVRGYGGWTTTPRAGRVARSTMPGMDTMAVQITLMLEGAVAASTSVDAKRFALEGIGGLPRSGSPEAQDTRRKPPKVRWLGNHWTDNARLPGTLWVCESLEWTGFHYDDDASLVRAMATLTLGWHYAPSLPTLQHATPFRQVTLERGENLRHLARRTLQDAKRWKDIATLNRNNPKCPSGPDFKVSKPVTLSIPPKD
jgi:hypothetical protein